MKKLLFILFVILIFLLVQQQDYFNDKEDVVENDFPTEFNEADFADMEDIALKDDGLASRITEANPATTNIENTRNATFFITTPWGSRGSGFILDTHCNAVTHSQLFKMDTSNLIAQRERLKKIIADIQQEIIELDQEFNYVTEVQGFGDNSRQIDAEMHELARIENNHQTQLDKLGLVPTRSDFKIKLIDGSEYKIERVKITDNSALAFFKIPATHCPYINVGFTNSLDEGQTLFTLGSGQGLDFRILEGDFLGNTILENKEYIQTNAPIHQTNTGGPLLDKQGDVIGLTTPKTLDQDEFGHAIPMHIIKKEFQKYSPQ